MTRTFLALSPVMHPFPHWPMQGRKRSPGPQIHRLTWVSRLKSAVYGALLITGKVLDVSGRSRWMRGRQGARSEPYGALRPRPVESLKVDREERSKATPLEPCEIPSQRADHALMVDQGGDGCLWSRVQWNIMLKGLGVKDIRGKSRQDTPYPIHDMPSFWSPIGSFEIVKDHDTTRFEMGKATNPDQ